MAEPARWRIRTSGVRVRTTLAVTVTTAIAAAIGAYALVAALGASLADGVLLSADTRAEEVAQQLADGTRVANLALVPEDDRFVHVVDPAGSVVAASPDGPTRPPAVPPDNQPIPDLAAVVDTEDGEDVYAVVAEQVTTAEGPLTVVVTQEASEVTDSQDALTGTLQIAVPAVVVTIGLVTWWLVGRALGPVEAIRARVEQITADRLERRVPVPLARDEVGELARTMNQMLDRLEAAQTRQHQLVSDASHELRSPATVIRQHAEVALAYPDSTTAADIAAVMLSEGRRLEKLVEQLLWLARTDEVTSAVRRHALDLDDLVLEEASRLRATVSVRVDTSQVSGGQVQGDPLMLRRVVANLLDNAVGHAASAVVVALSEDAGSVTLRVDDDGPGIPVADRARVLERFVRLDESRSRDRGGAGLGLAIVQGIVRAHGGTVEVGESPAGGARFTVTLPRGGTVQAPVSETALVSPGTNSDDSPGGNR